jgi:hypothetical protein
MRSRCCCYGEASSCKKSIELGALRQAERSKEGRKNLLPSCTFLLGFLSVESLQSADRRQLNHLKCAH